MLLQEEGDWVRADVDKRPKGDLVESNLRQRTTNFITLTKQGQKPPTLISEEGLGRENQIQMAALAQPPLEIPPTCGPTGQQLRAAGLKLLAVFVRYIIGRRLSVNPKSKMDHPLGRNQSTLGRGNEVP